MAETVNWQAAMHWTIFFGAVGMTRDPIWPRPIKLHRRSWTDDGRRLTWTARCGQALAESVNFANYRGRTFRLCLHCFVGGGYAEVDVKQDWLNAHRSFQAKLDV